MTRPFPLLAAAVLLLSATPGAPQAPAALEKSYNPCKTAEPHDPRIVIALVSGSGGRGGGTCRAVVQPSSKRVCAGSTVRWSVVNTCDTTALRDLLIPDLDRVTGTPCSEVKVDVKPGAVAEIACTLKRDIQVRAKYSVATGSRDKHRVLVDPELDIRR
jgi:hypothetical protein